MVDSINGNSTANSLLRAQQIQNTAATSRVAPTTLDQTRSNAVVKVKAASVPQTTKLQGTSVAVGSNTVLPRGSIVDKLV